MVERRACHTDREIERIQRDGERERESQKRDSKRVEKGEVLGLVKVRKNAGKKRRK